MRYLTRQLALPAGGTNKYSPPPSASFLPGAAFPMKVLTALSESLPKIPPAMFFPSVRFHIIPPTIPPLCSDCNGQRKSVLDDQHAENKRKTPSLGRRWMLLEVLMVEAGGIEPPSASPLQTDLHT